MVAVWLQGVAFSFILIAFSVDLPHHIMDLSGDGWGDIFGAALGEAPSQDTAVPREAAGVPTIVIADDDSIGRALLEDSNIPNPWSITEEMPSKSETSCEGIPSESEARCFKKRKQPYRAMQRREGTLRLEALEASDGCDVMCVFIPKKCGNVAVPLWRQHKASWKGHNVGDAKFIVVSYSEVWLRQLVDAVTTKCVRQVAQAFAHRLEQEFKICVASARAPAAPGDDSDHDSDDPRDPALAGKRNRPHEYIAVVEIQLGGFTVKCLNYMKKWCSS
jgi:hypothetical protein